jgi:tRNA/rRNA methyltransferase
LNNYRVILVEPAFEESIGFVARAMKNFGLDDLHLVAPRTVLSDNGKMRGAHAQEILASITTHTSLQESLARVDLAVGTTAQKGFSDLNLLRRSITPRQLGRVLTGTTGNVALVFGREGTGLNNGELGLCDVTVTIPAAEEYPTLNLSHAAAIVFYELFCTSTNHSTDELAAEDVKSTILRYMSESSTLVGLEDYKTGLTLRAFKNLLGRAAVRKREGSLLAGLFRQIAVQLRAEPASHQAATLMRDGSRTGIAD